MMDELFDIKPVNKAHGIMLERLQELEAVAEHSGKGRMVTEERVENV